MNRRTMLARNLTLAILAFSLIAAIGVHAQTYTILHSFGGQNDGVGPLARLVFDPLGNLYGTTLTGGIPPNVYGTVFQLSPHGDGTWSESVIHSFDTEGDGQTAPVALDVRGNLYGEIQYGGNRYGSIYELSPDGHGGWSIQTLHTFTGYPDGTGPTGGLTIASGNQVYGVTNYGGARDIGMVFDFNHLLASSWNEFKLHSFLGADDGAYPEGPLTLDPAGNLYGVASGGSGNNTMVYKLTPNHRSFGWGKSLLHTFQYPYGTPNGGLLIDAAGNIYGTGYEDGRYFQGTVYKLSPNSDGTWTYTVLYEFTGANGDGAYVNGGLVMDAAGNLYGTTRQGGTTQGFYCMYGGCGTIFKLTPSANGQWVESIVYTFNSNDGNGPSAGLVQDRAGNLYGTAGGGGTYNAGVVFELTP